MLSKNHIKRVKCVGRGRTEGKNCERSLDERVNRKSQ